jgi:hypothetical protein
MSYLPVSITYVAVDFLGGIYYLSVVLHLTYILSS